MPEMKQEKAQKAQKIKPIPKASEKRAQTGSRQAAYAAALLRGTARGSALNVPQLMALAAAGGNAGVNALLTAQREDRVPPELLPDELNCRVQACAPIPQDVPQERLPEMEEHSA